MMKGWHNGTVDQRTLYPEASLFAGPCMLAKGGPKFKGLEEGQKLSQSWIKKHFVLTDPVRISSSDHYLRGKEREF